MRKNLKSPFLPCLKAPTSGFYKVGRSFPSLAKTNSRCLKQGLGEILGRRIPVKPE